MHRARAEARAEAEAEAQLRFAATLAHERAEPDKQVQLSLFVRQCVFMHRPSLLLQSVHAPDSG